MYLVAITRKTRNVLFSPTPLTCLSVAVAVADAVTVAVAVADAVTVAVTVGSRQWQ
jgi:hypothetical protein